MTGEADFWSATLEAFAPLHLASPQLTPALLKRPPFRFIHDIVSAINTQYGTFVSAIPAELREADKIDGKERKIEYLTALKEYVSQLQHRTLEVNPKKVIAGAEPEKTNAFLQSLAAAVDVAREGGVQPSTAQDTHGTRPAAVAAATVPAPRRGHSPARPHGHDAARAAESAAVMQEAKAFNDKLAGYAVDLSLGTQRSVTEEGQSIVQMWQDLQHPVVETTPTQLSAEGLEMAIKRQLEAVRQVQRLGAENDQVIEKMEGLLM